MVGDMKRGFLIGIVILILALGAWVFWKPSLNDTNEHLSLSGTVVSPQGVEISVRVAETEKQRALGLSFFSQLPVDQGMLFVFPQPGEYSFWMKDMQIPLDIIWIDTQGTIVDRALSVSPDTYPKTFTPQALAQYVLEVPANTADANGFTIGASVILENN